MPLSYRDVYDQWERSRAFGDKRPIEQFASDMDKRAKMGMEPGRKFGDFSAPRSAGWWTKASTAADVKFFEPLAKATGLEDLGAAVAPVFGGTEETGRKFARGLPRMLTQTLPLYAAELIPGAQPFVTPAAIAATGALFGAQTYADTQSAGQAVLSGVTAAAIPSIGKFSGKLAAKAFGAPALEEATEVGGKMLPRGTVIPQTATQRVARAVGAQAGIYGTFLGQQTLATGKFDPTDPQLLMQTIPFTIFDIYGSLKVPKTMPATKPKVELPEEVPYRPPPTDPAHAAAMGEVIDHLCGNHETFIPVRGW